MITKQQLGNILFGMIDTTGIRTSVEDYKAYVLSLLFFKRLSDNYQWENKKHVNDFIKEHGREPNAKQREKILRDKHDFIIPDGCFWDDVRKASMNKKNDALNKAVKGIADINQSLRGIINSVRWNEPAPDGSGKKKLNPEVLTSMINYLDAVPLDNDNASVDILGDAYEYLIKRFADENKGGTVAGQFYTPQEVVEIIVRYLKPKKGDQIYDPTCGSGGFLIHSAKYAKEKYGNQKGVRLYGQEDVWNNWAICSINMILHGLDAEIKKEDTIIRPQFIDAGEVQKFDLVMANFPFSNENWWKNGTPKKDKKGKTVTKKDGTPQFNYPSKDTFADPYNRFDYGIPPFSNGDFAFLQHIVASISDKGRAGVVCPQGVLFRGQPEKTEEEDGQNRKADDEYLIRRGFLEGLGGKYKNIIEAVVVLPQNLFYGTPIPGAIVFFNKNKPKEREDKVLMVFAARQGWYKEQPNLNVLLPHDVLRIMTILESWGDIKVAEQFIPEQEKRLYQIIDETLAFKIAGIEQDFEDETKEYAEINSLLNQPETSKTDKVKLDKRKDRLQKIMEKKNNLITDAKEQAAKEKEAILKVREEILTVLKDPEERKRYFSIADKADIEDNEFNLNIPRFVDTFEPEEEIKIGEAKKEFLDSLNNAEDIEKNMKKFLESIS